MRHIYLVLAIAGAVFPWFYNIQFMRAGGGLLDFIQASSVSAATQSIALDLFISTLAGCLWILVESRRLKMRHGWFFVVYAFCIAFASALPLFLYLRQRKLERN